MHMHRGKILASEIAANKMTITNPIIQNQVNSSNVAIDNKIRK